MNERETEILQAAIEVFSRYGVKRATMSDIAQQAGISRQTLYASFAGKDEVLTAVIRATLAAKLAAVRAAWANAESMEDKLDAYFDHGVRPVFDKLRSMPDFIDLLDGFSPEGKIEKAKAEEEKKRMLGALFQTCRDTLAPAGSSPETLADLIVTSADGFVFAARDRGHLDQLLANLKQAVLALCGNPD